MHGKQEAKISSPTPKQPKLQQSWRGLEDPSSRVCSALRSQARGIGLSGLHAKSLSRKKRIEGSTQLPRGVLYLLVL